MSAPRPLRVLEYGKDEPLPESIPLRAGPFEMIFQNGDLRCIRLGEREVIRRIYAAVRDQNWGTVLGKISNLKIEPGESSFRIEYDSDHTEREISFAWHAEIAGRADGEIRFSFDGKAQTTFFRNRIGFCVLHPIRECAGAKCRVEYMDGSQREAVFPALVAAEQPVKDIHDLRALAQEVEPGVWAEVRFEGDIFEIEDQRNWIDASYKTFCTPLRLPYPVEIQAGTRIQQSVRLKLLGAPAAPVLSRPPRSSAREPVRLRLEPWKSRPLCPVGLGVSSFQKEYGDALARALRSLHLSHLRAELRLSDPAWKKALEHAEWEASVLAVPLEISLTLGDHVDLSYFAAWARDNANLIKRWLILPESAPTTDASGLRHARRQLGAMAPVGAGTGADFYQLNQQRPPWREADFVGWSMNPQVHAFDNLSLAETPEAETAQILSAREYFPGKPLVVGPVTLRPRFNPAAAGPELEPLPGQLPASVDARQMSQFGAVWTLASLKYLAEAGVDSATYFETAGWRGVIEREEGSPQPGLFQSRPGEPFPMFEVFRWIGEFAGGEVVTSVSSDAVSANCLCLAKGGKKVLLAGNFTPQAREMELENLALAGGVKKMVLEPFQTGRWEVET